MISKAHILSSWQDLPWHNIKQKSSHYLPKLVVVIFVILLVQTFAQLSWKLFSVDHKAVASSQRPQVPSRQPLLSSSSLKDVAAYHLFGDAKKQIVMPQKIIDAPETRLRLDLKGTFATSNSSEAMAIISSSKNKDKTYHIGDKVIGGALLHAVYEDRVILKRNGQLETLRLPKAKLENNAVTQLKPEIQNNVASRQNKPVQSNANPAVSQSQRLRDMRDTLIKEPAKIWQQVRINPVMENGKVQGYTLAHNDPGLMAALKLRKTDVITAVNGQSLSDPATLYGLMSTLSEQQSLELTLKRNGQEQTIQLSF